jgi:integral membrane protein
MNRVSSVAAFRAAAIIEAVTWVGLLVAMFVERVLDGGDSLMGVFGPLHGVVALVYVAVAVWAGRELRWGNRTLLAALLVSVPPFGTVLFERWATRNGLLDLARSRRRPA